MCRLAQRLSPRAIGPHHVLRQVASPMALSTTVRPPRLGSTAGATAAERSPRSVFVTSSEFPMLEGCLSEIEIFAGGEIEYLNEAGTGVIYATVPTGQTEVRAREASTTICINPGCCSWWVLLLSTMGVDRLDPPPLLVRCELLLSCLGHAWNRLHPTRRIVVTDGWSLYLRFIEGSLPWPRRIEGRM